MLPFADDGYTLNGVGPEISESAMAIAPDIEGLMQRHVRLRTATPERHGHRTQRFARR